MQSADSYFMTTTFSNHVKFKSSFGEVKYSNALGHYLYSGATSGLALKYVLKGEEVYYINGKEIPVIEDHFILIRPGTSFEAVSISRSKETKGLCVDMSFVFPKANIGSILSNEILFNKSFGFSKSTFIGRQLEQATGLILSDSSYTFGNDFLSHMGNHLSIFSKNVLNYKKGISTVAKKESTQQYIIPKLLLAKEYVAGHYTERLLLSELAQHVGMSKFQFLKLFKICFNCSPQEMQASLRMRAAKGMLQDNLLSITDIAFELGYFDLAAFSRKFKSHFGVSPTYFKN